MRVIFKDFYGQHVELHNETGTGNIRLRVMTMENLNDLPGTKPEDCDLDVDISLTVQNAKLLIFVLDMMAHDGKGG